MLGLQKVCTALQIHIFGLRPGLVRNADLEVPGARAKHFKDTFAEMQALLGSFQRVNPPFQEIWLA